MPEKPDAMPTKPNADNGSYMSNNVVPNPSGGTNAATTKAPSMHVGSTYGNVGNTPQNAVAGQKVENTASGATSRPQQKVASSAMPDMMTNPAMPDAVHNPTPDVQQTPADAVPTSNVGPTSQRETSEMGNDDFTFTDSQLKKMEDNDAPATKEESQGDALRFRFDPKTGKRRYYNNGGEVSTEDSPISVNEKEDEPQKGQQKVADNEKGERSALDALADIYKRKKKEEESKIETPEQQKKREKRERTNKIIAALGDGISAMANLGFARKGAANTLHPEYNLTRGLNERFEKLKKEREASMDRVLALQEKLAEIDNVKYGRKQKEADAKREQDNWDKKYALEKEKAESENALRDVRAALYQNKSDLTDKQIEALEQKIEHLKVAYPLEAANLEATLAVKKTQAAKNAAQAKKAASGGGKKSGGGAKTTSSHSVTYINDQGQRVTDRTTTRR